MTGQVVRGKQYFSRVKEENRIWRRLNSGSHILLLAPRRVGKSSLLRHLEDNPKDGYVFLYSIVQSCGSEHEYYAAIIENLFKTDFTSRLGKAMKRGKDAVDSLRSCLKGVKVGELGLTFENELRQLSHQDLKTALLSLNCEHKLVLVIDEFPDVLEKIHNENGHNAAHQFLSGCRTLCQDPELDQKVQFVFTGSIGLDTLVAKLNLSNMINVLHNCPIKPLTSEQGIEFLDFLINNSSPPFTITADAKLHLLKKVEWLMPYYIDIFWAALEDLCDDEDATIAEPEHVDRAYETLFESVYKKNFSHWVERLERLEDSERLFAKQLLKLLTEQSRISPQELFNLKQDPAFADTRCDYVCDCLEHDGYIFYIENDYIQFTSPMLKRWWGRYAARNL